MQGSGDGSQASTPASTDVYVSADAYDEIPMPLFVLQKLQDKGLDSSSDDCVDAGITDGCNDGADIIAKHDDGDDLLNDVQMVAGAMPSAIVAVGEQLGETIGDAIEVLESGDEADDDLLKESQHVAGHMPSTCSAKTIQKQKKKIY